MSDAGATTSGPSSGSPAGGPELRRWWLLAVVVAAVLVIGGGAVAVVVSGVDGDPDGGHVMGVAPPVELTTLSEDVAVLYRFAEGHQAELAQVPCFCGCEEFLAHESLYDCFVRADGAGYDSHAAGCGVCLGEAAVASDLLAAGTSAGQVAQRIIEQFGTTPITSPDQTVPRR